MGNRFLNVLKFIIGWPFSLLALFFIARTFTPQTAQLVSKVQTINITLLLYSIVCFVIFYFFRGYIWQRLLQGHGYSHISLKEATYLWAISELKRYIPGNIWSFLGRTMLFSDKGVKKSDTAKSILIEAEFFVLGCLVLALLSLPLLLPLLYIADSFLMRMLFGSAVGLIALFCLFNRKFTHWLPDKVRSILHFSFSPYPPQENLMLLGLNIVSVLFFGIGYYFAISSVMLLDPQLFFVLSGFFVLAFVAGYLSFLTPAGFGVREGILIAGLAKFMSISNAAFVSLFARFVLIVAELLFLGLCVAWYRIKNNYITKIETWVSNHKQLTILFFLYGLFCLYFINITFLRYDNFYTGRFDLGNMAQTVWNTAHGRIFLFTNPNGTDPISRLAFHADFLLILLTPFYYIWANPKMLLLIQTVVCGAGAFFVYALGRDIIKNKNIALLFAFAYLINPSIERTVLYDFHSVTLATTFLLGTYYFYRKKRYLLFLLFAFLSAICKEQLWVIIAIFGGFLFFQQKKRLFGSILTIVCLAIGYFLISYAIPHLLGGRHFALSYYSDFGDSPAQIIQTVLFSPQKIIATILEPDRIRYLQQLFSPLGYLSILTPWLLIFAFPELLINLLSNNTQVFQIYYQYTASLSPFIFIAAIYSVAWLRKIWSFRVTEGSRGIFLNPNFHKKDPSTSVGMTNTILIIFLLFTSLYTAYSDGPLPGARASNLDMITRPVADRAFIDMYLHTLPHHFSVAASNNVGSHLSQRQRIYTVPLGIDKADVIVFLLTDPASVQSEKKMIAKLQKDPAYILTVERGQFIVYTKNYDTSY